MREGEAGRREQGLARGSRPVIWFDAGMARDARERQGGREGKHRVAFVLQHLAQRRPMTGTWGPAEGPTDNLTTGEDRGWEGSGKEEEEAASLPHFSPGFRPGLHTPSSAFTHSRPAGPLHEPPSSAASLRRGVLLLQGRGSFSPLQIPGRGPAPFGASGKSCCSRSSLPTALRGTDPPSAAAEGLM